MLCACAAKLDGAFSSLRLLRLVTPAMVAHNLIKVNCRVSLATAKKSALLQSGGGGLGGGSSSALQGALGDLDPSNTTLFIGGLSAAVCLLAHNVAVCCV